jgi:hypothetical protein
LLLKLPTAVHALAEVHDTLCRKPEGTIRGLALDTCDQPIPHAAAGNIALAATANVTSSPTRFARTLPPFVGWCRPPHHGM